MIVNNMFVNIEINTSLMLKSTSSLKHNCNVLGNNASFI